jgi:hypothetical protein
MILSRIVLVEDLAPLAVDKAHADALQGAHKDLVELVDKLRSRDPQGQSSEGVLRAIPPAWRLVVAAYGWWMFQSGPASKRSLTSK